MIRDYEFNYKIITEESDIVDALNELGSHPTYAIDCESTGLDPRKDVIVGISIANQDTAFYFTQNALVPFADKLRKRAQDPNHLFVFHNALFDLHFIAQLGVEFAKVADTMIASFMVDENRSQGLKPLAEHYLNISLDLPTFSDMQKELYQELKEQYKEDLKAYRKNNPAGGTPLFGKEDNPPEMRFSSYREITALDIDPNKFGRYAALDARLTYDLWLKMQYFLQKEELEDVFWNIEMAFIPVLYQMERSGIGIDKEQLYILEQTYTQKMSACEEKLQGMVGGDFNPNSTQQLAEYLYEQRGFKTTLRTESGAPSTNVLALQRLETEDESGFITTLLDYRKYSKLLSTYVQPFIELVESQDTDEPRIYGSYNQTGTVTGRLCVSGDTQIETNYGIFSIKDLQLIEKIKTISHKGISQNITNKFYKGKEQMYNVTLENGSTIRVTAGHKFLTSNGWRSLGELEEGDTILTNPNLETRLQPNEVVEKISDERFRFDNTEYQGVRIATIEPAGVEDVWDIEVENDHSYIAQGFINHNSSSNPNLQNIPSHGETGDDIRKLFVARKGYLIVNCDYSQLELRILAHYANDEDYIRAFMEGGDPHQQTADLVGVERSIGKTLNFAWAYGAGPRKLCDTIESSGYPRPNENVAREWIAGFEEARPALVDWKNKVIEWSKKLGYVRTVAKRKRHLQGIKSYDGSVRGRAERQAVNSIIQGSASDIIKYASIILYDTFKQKHLDAKIIGQVHDELLIEAREDQAEEVAKITKQIMEKTGEVFDLRVKLEADPGVDKSWYGAH